MKKVLAVLLAVLFVVSLTAAAASAEREGHHGNGGGCGGCGSGWGCPMCCPVGLGWPVSVGYGGWGSLGGYGAAMDMVSMAAVFVAWDRVAMAWAMAVGAAAEYVAAGVAMTAVVVD